MLLNERSTDLPRVAMARITMDLVHAPAGARKFLELLFAIAGKTPTIRALAGSIGVQPGTLMSRFFRAKLPPPKKYLAYARLCCAAHLFENPGVSVASVSHQLDYSSPQSFSRHVRAILQVGALEFRTRYDGEGMLECFREHLILRFHSEWLSFDPFGRPVRDRNRYGTRKTREAVEQLE